MKVDLGCRDPCVGGEFSHFDGVVYLAIVVEIAGVEELLDRRIA